MKKLLLVALLVPAFAAALVEGQKPSTKLQNYTETLPGGVKLEMMAIPGGAFKMGDGRDWRPIHEVALKPFYIGKFEVTQAQWKSVMGSNPSSFTGSNLPVERVSWVEAKEFCKKLSEMTGKKYRLPSEAEWEYAARAGSQGIWYFGDDENRLGEYAWYYKNSESKTHPVGQKKPNAWGLYDMCGNVEEWCEDVYHENYDGAPSDGSAWVTGGEQASRILRGGSWDSGQYVTRSAPRNHTHFSSDIHSYQIGFRVVCEVRLPSK